MNWHTAYLGLGSNLGDRPLHLRRAVEHLGADPSVLVVLRTGPIIETEPVDCPPGSSRFLNTVIEVRTTLTPDELLEQLRLVEASAGRLRPTRNAPREIDLDLLLYEDLVLNGPGLIVPHPRMHERTFVLEPLAALVPDLIHPTLKQTVRDLLKHLNDR